MRRSKQTVEGEIFLNGGNGTRLVCGEKRRPHYTNDTTIKYKRGLAFYLLFGGQLAVITIGALVGWGILK